METIELIKRRKNSYGANPSSKHFCSLFLGTARQPNYGANTEDVRGTEDDAAVSAASISLDSYTKWMTGDENK